MGSASDTILITGINGFTGWHLENHLVGKGYTVAGTSVTASARYHTCDFTRKKQVAEVVQRILPDYVIHLAGISFTEHDKPDDFYAINLFGTLNLLEALVKAQKKPKRVILASSAAVYGPREGVLDETMCPAPVNHYGMSKLAMEHMAATFRSQLDLVLVRPFNYTGPGQPDHFVIPKIVSAYRSDAAVLSLGNIDVVREFNNVRMALEIYEKLLTAGKNPGVVNLCSGKGYCLLDVIRLMEDITGRKMKIETDPALVRKNEIAKLIGSPARLENCIGPFKKYDLRETLAWMYEV
ncbi:MAG: GDP-mannose 4,6-dehydratase [Desulfobulbaceae bacterium]|nr:GDP-mannose 4,6-dehydratase [Desulfobulbaceae bacterium]